MGSACCVAARDRTIINGSSRDNIQRNIRYSPSWSVRWDNRRRVAGEEASVNWFSGDLGTNDRLDNKSQTTVGAVYASEEGSPLESFRNQTWQKSSSSEGYTVPQSDQSVSQITSEGKASSETQPASEPSPIMMPASTRSVSEEGGSPFMLSGWSNESTRGSHVGSSDNWPVPAFNELKATSHSHRSRWSFDSESVNVVNHDKISSRTASIDMHTCGICSMLLTQRSSWGTHKYILANEVPVVAILICGHVYHSECLEQMTSEIDKYDPSCPVCTLGVKQVLKLSEKAMKGDSELKAWINKKSKRRMVDGDDIMFDNHKISPKMRSSSSMKFSSGKPFLKRHFSFGSKGSWSLSDNNSPRKKGFFWTKSSKE